MSLPTDRVSHFEAKRKPGTKSGTKVKSSQCFVSVCEAIGGLPPWKAGQSVDGEPYATPPESQYQENRRKGALAVFNHTARSHSKAFLKKIGPIRPGKKMQICPTVNAFLTTIMVCTLTYNNVGQVVTESYVGGSLDRVCISDSYDSLLRRTNLTTFNASDGHGSGDLTAGHPGQARERVLDIGARINATASADFGIVSRRIQPDAG